MNTKLNTFSKYILTVEITPPLMTQHLGVLPFGYDKKTLTDDEGRLLIPSSLLKGHIREELDAIDNKDIAQKWFGKADSLGESQGIIIFEPYLRSEKDHESLSERTRVKGVDSTGKVQQGQLQVAAVADLIKQTEEAQQEITTIEFTLNLIIYGEEQSDTAKKLRRAVKLIHALGSDKSIGFGQINSVEIALQNSKKGNLSAPELVDHQIGITITPDWHFCFPDGKSKSNHISTLDYIPGSAIKAAIASCIDLKDIQDLFDKTTFSHCLPRVENNTYLPKAIAQSTIVKKETDERSHFSDINDKLNLAENQSENSKVELISYPIDWKSTAHKQANEINKIISPLPRDLTVRNSHSTANNSATDGELFSIETINPNKLHDSDQLQWSGTISFPKTGGKSTSDTTKMQAIEDFLKLITSHAILGAGIIPKLGKTHTPAKLELHKPMEMAEGIPQTPKPNHWVLTLQSDAWILNSDEVDFKSSETTLTQVYNNAFNDLLKTALTEALQQDLPEESPEETLNLTAIYTQEKLVKQHKHWNIKKGESIHSLPITEAGSVFVFEVSKNNTKTLEAVFDQWLHHGLPQRSCSGYSSALRKQISRKATFDRHNFAHNKYLRENGYGSIILAKGSSEENANSAQSGDQS